MVALLRHQTRSVPTLHSFARRKRAGQKLRRKPGIWERTANRQQRALVRAYDSWSVAARRTLRADALAGASDATLRLRLRQMIEGLEGTLGRTAVDGADTAAQAVLRGRDRTRGISGVVSRARRTALQAVTRTLVPAVEARISRELTTGLAADRTSLRRLFDTMRSRVAGYSGLQWSEIHELERELGRDRERQRLAQGLEPERVRWTLDRFAEHCQATPNTFGCPDLAREYRSWDELPAMPGSQRVTCSGNCRCVIETFINGRWRRRAS